VAGTTSVYNYRDHHPAVHTSPSKEPAFFAADFFEHKRLLGLEEPDSSELRAHLEGAMTVRRSGVISDWDQYLR